MILLLVHLLQALVFLLQIQLARMALERARVRTWAIWKQHESAQHPARKGPDQYSRTAASATVRHVGMSQKQEDCALQEMIHFVNNLHRFVVDRLVHAAWAQLGQVRSKFAVIAGSAGPDA